MRLRELLPLVTIVLLTSAPHVSGATWVEAKSPNFTVYSDAGAKRARDVAWQFEQVRAALSRLWPWARFEFGAPVVVYAARDERTMRALLPHYFEGRNAMRPGSLFVSAGEAHYVALNTDQSTGGAVNVNPYIASYWSYVMMVLQSTYDQELPPWFERGLAAVFSNTIVRQKEILIGPLIPWYLERLREGSRPTLDVMLAAGAKSPELASGDRMQRFDATAWALVHYLIFGNQGKNIRLFNEFADAVRKGAEPMDALAKAYGSIVSIREGLARYIDQTLFVYQKAEVSLGIEAAGFRTRDITPAEAAIALARFHAATRRPEEARAQIAAAGNPPAGGEIEGTLLDRDGQRDGARTAYARASDAGEATFYAEYRFASLLWPSEGEPSTESLVRMEKALQRSVSLNPAFAPSHVMLAEVLVQLERYADAVPVATRAEALDRRNMHAQTSLSRALWGVGRRDEAMAAAKRALSLSISDSERRAAQRLIDFLAKSPARTTAASPAAETPANADESRQLFDACNKGDNAACGTLSGMFDRACKAGDGRGCMMTAFFLLEGRGVPKDEARGMAVLEPLCNGSVPEACVPIANVLMARGDAANRARAKELLTKSCAAGAAEACDLAKTVK